MLKDKILAELLGELDQLADEVVEEWLSPEECCIRLSGIIGYYRETKLSSLSAKCLEDVSSLLETIELERSTPDVVQEYLFYTIDRYLKEYKNRKNNGWARCRRKKTTA